ncbi:MAG: YdcF family protein [Bdellovibrionales bacterium]
MWRRLALLNLLVLVVLVIVRFRIEYDNVTGTPPTAWREDIQADCAIVVTGGPGRVREGLDLLYRGAVKKLIVSGVHPKVEWREVLPQWSLYGGLREDDVVLERRSTTTYGNAIQSLPLVEALHCRSVALVTSTLHMHRAYQTFRGVFPQDFPIVVYAMVGGELRPDLASAWGETVKSFFYSLWAY